MPGRRLCLLKISKVAKVWRFREAARNVPGCSHFLSTWVSWVAWRFRSRAELELELIALRHQVAVLNRQQSGRLRLCSIDRMLWVWLYRVWPRCFRTMVLVKPAVAPPGLSALLALGGRAQGDNP